MFLRIFDSFIVCGHLFITLGGIPLYWVLAVLGTMLAFTFTSSLCGGFFHHSRSSYFHTYVVMNSLCYMTPSSTKLTQAP